MKNYFLELLLFNITLIIDTKLLVQNKHSIFAAEKELTKVVDSYHCKYALIVKEVIGRKPKLPFTPDEIIKIIDGINKNTKLKALADGDFCFKPALHMMPEGTPCGCIYCEEPHCRPKK